MRVFRSIISLFYVSTVLILAPSEYFSSLSESENYILLDTRMYEQYIEERIPGALWAGESAVLDTVLEGLDKSTDIFIYCSYGDRTRPVLKILKRKGFKFLFDLDGGLERWYEEGFPIDDSRIVGD